MVAICLGAYLGAFLQSVVIDLDCGRGPSAILTTTYQIKVQSVNLWNFVTERDKTYRDGVMNPESTGRSHYRFRAVSFGKLRVSR